MTPYQHSTQGVALPIYSFPTIGNPSSASTRSVMMALGLVVLSLFSGFGVMYLVGLLGVDSSRLLWVPILFAGPAVVFAMFAVVKDEAKREARFRDMSMLVSDALVFTTGLELNERDIRRMVEGDVIDVENGTLRIEQQQNGRSSIMTLIREEYPEPQEEQVPTHHATIEPPVKAPEPMKPEPAKEPSPTGTTLMPVLSKRPEPATQKQDITAQKPKVVPMTSSTPGTTPK